MVPFSETRNKEKEITWLFPTIVPKNKTQTQIREAD